MSFPAVNPLDIPEILRAVSRLVAPKDALACARVCKSWSVAFAAVIWHTIDFDVHSSIHRVDIRTLATHGRHIRVARNVKDYSHVGVLAASNATRLREITVTMVATQGFYVCCGNLLQKNNTTIQRIKMTQPSAITAPQSAADKLFSESNMGSTCTLSTLKIEGLAMSRDGFSSLLQHCPLLNTLDIRDTSLSFKILYDNAAGTGCFKHSKLRTLSASVKQVFAPDQSNNTPSLLIHFPRLRMWQIWSSSTTDSLEIPIEEFRGQVAKYCPSIKYLTACTRPPMTITMLTHVFSNLTKISVNNRYLSTEVAMAILHHQETLTYVATYIHNRDDFLNSEKVPDVARSRTEATGWVIQSILQFCTQLSSFQLPFYEMSMDDINKARWNCHNLERLYIRIQGLNTKEKINRAIQLWTDARISNVSIPKSDGSIEAHVARHLVQFKKLRAVWLGWKVRKVA